MLRKVRIGSVGIGTALLLVLLAAAPGSAARASNEITVTAADYAFAGIPASLPAGRTFFALRNEGKVRHELSIVRLKAGVTAEEAIATIKAGGRRRDSTDGAAVLVIAAPGDEAARARVVVDLKQGETYLVVCTLKDKPDTPPHIMLGMYTSFRVE